MLKSQKLINAFLAFSITLLFTSCSENEKTPQRNEVISIIEKVNCYWQTTNPEHGRPFWDNAAYHTGNMEAYFLTGNENYKDYSHAWSERNGWNGAKSNNREEWLYNYGETDKHVLFGDWQICFQTYADLYNIDPDPRKIERALEVMEYPRSTTANDYWWWYDGL